MMPDPPVRRFRLAATAALYALGFAALAWPWLSGRVTIPWDAKSTTFPNLVFLARSLASGQWPSWTPNVYAGWPQIADPQSAMFSPFHVLLALFDATPGFVAADAVAFALLFAGGLGVILIYMQRSWHEAGAVVAALAFAFGGSNASRLQHIGLLESACWLPLALFFLTRALDRASWGWGAAAGLAAGLVALGRDQVSLLGLYVLVGYTLWHWLAGKGIAARIGTSARPLAAGAIAGALVVALPLLFTAMLALSSNRPEIGYDIAARGSLHPADLLMLAFADLFGAADPNVPYWGPPSFPWHETFGTTDLYHAQNIGQLYAGMLVPVALIGFGLLRGFLWAREIRFFTAALVLMLLYALGKYTPAFEAMYEFLPGVSLYRRPADATFPLGLLLAICAGFCLHRWLINLEPAGRPWQLRMAGLAGLVLLAGAAALAIRIGPWRDALWPLGIGIVTALCAIGALRLAYRLHATHALLAALVLGAFATADLAVNNAPHESNALPPSHYDALRPDTQNETVTLLKSKLAEAPERRDRVEMIGIGYHWPNLGLVHGFDHLFGHNPLRLREFGLATGVADTVAVPDQRPFSRLLPAYNSPLENLFGVRFVATGVPAEQIDKALKPGDLVPLARTTDAYIYENPHALPRVMLIADWRLADFEDMLRTGVWPDADPRTTVLLERAPRPSFPPAAVTGGAARIVSYANTEIVIETDTPANAMLVLNDAWHPWWRATMDGTPAEILRANLLFRAVAVPPGRHTVRFSFHPVGGALAQLRDKISALWR
jgi:hypothetical protein